MTGGVAAGSAGCFNPSSIAPQSSPGVLRRAPAWLVDPQGPLRIRWSHLPALTPWLWRFARAGTPDRIVSQARALNALLVTGLEDMADLAASAGAGHLIERSGHLVAYSSPAHLAADAASWRLRTQNGVEFEPWDEARIRDFDPALGPQVKAAVFIPGNGHAADPERLLALICDQARRDGVTFRHGWVKAVRPDADGRVELIGVQAPNAFDAVVIATGAGSNGLMQGLGEAVPLEAEGGYHLMIRDPEAIPRVPVTDAAGKFVATPMAGGLRLAGTAEFGGLNVKPDWRRARVLLRQAQRLLPGLVGDHPESRLSSWHGLRPSLPDSLPVIGRSGKAPNVFYAFGHGHIGLTAAATTGRLIADLIDGRPPAIDLHPFRVDRFRP